MLFNHREGCIAPNLARLSLQPVGVKPCSLQEVRIRTPFFVEGFLLGALL